MACLSTWFLSSGSSSPSRHTLGARGEPRHGDADRTVLTPRFDASKAVKVKSGTPDGDSFAYFQGDELIGSPIFGVHAAAGRKIPFLGWLRAAAAQDESE